MRLPSTGPPLGLLPPGMPFEEMPLTIAAGDCVLLYSDGVVDAQNAEGDEFGEARLLGIVRASLNQASNVIVDRVIDAIDRFAGDTPQFDDITLLVLRRLPSALGSV